MMVRLWLAFPLLVALAHLNPPQGRTAAPRETDPDRGIGADLYDDPLPRGAVARFGTRRFNHPGEIASIAFDPSGKMIASASKKVIQLWDQATGKEIRQFHGHAEAVPHIAFSPNGRTLASASVDKTIRLWEVQSGRQLRVLEGHEGPVTFVTFSPDGSTLASFDYYKQIRLWSVGTGKAGRRIARDPENSLTRLTFSPDGKSLFAGGEKELEQWELLTGKLACTFARAGVLSPNCRLLASYGDEAVSLWDMVSGKELWKVGCHRWVTALAFSPDGKILAAAGLGGVFMLWRVENGKEIRQILVPDFRWSKVLLFSPDSKTLVADAGSNFIRLWETATGETVGLVVGHYRGLRCVAFSPDGRRIFSASDDDTVRLWDVFTGRELRRLKEDPLDLSGQHRLMDVFSLCWSPSQAILAAGSWNRVYLLDGRTAQPISVWYGSEDHFITHVAFSGDGKTLVWGLNTHAVYIVDIGKSATERSLMGLSKRWPRRIPGFALALAPDGKTVVCGQEREPYLFRDLATGKPLYPLGASVTGLRSIAFLPDGNRLVSVNLDDTISLWEAQSGKMLRSSKHGGNARVASLAPDGKTLAIGNADGTISLWDVGTGRERHRFEGHQSAVTCVGFSRAGNLLVSGSEDATILVWDTEGRLGKRKPLEFPLSVQEADRLWDGLGSDDVVEVHWSNTGLVEEARREPLVVLGRLRAMFEVDEKKVAQLVGQLEDERFEVREKASRELRSLEDLAEPALRRALAELPSPDLRRRLDALLANLDFPDNSPRQARLQRAVAVLERVGTAGAIRALLEISKGAPGKWLRQQAKQALDRLERVRGSKQ